MADENANTENKAKTLPDEAKATGDQQKANATPKPVEKPAVPPNSPADHDVIRLAASPTNSISLVPPNGA